MTRAKNELDDFIINGKLTIKELYELAVLEGFEDRHLFFSVKNKTTGQHFSTSTVVDFGKGWAKDSAIMHLTWEELPESGCKCSTLQKKNEKVSIAKYLRERRAIGSNSKAKELCLDCKYRNSSHKLEKFINRTKRTYYRRHND